jgi:hypothetical protein
MKNVKAFFEMAVDAVTTTKKARETLTRFEKHLLGRYSSLGYQWYDLLVPCSWKIRDYILQRLSSMELSPVQRSDIYDFQKEFLNWDGLNFAFAENLYSTQTLIMRIFLNDGMTPTQIFREVTERWPLFSSKCAETLESRLNLSVAQLVELKMVQQEIKVKAVEDGQQQLTGLDALEEINDDNTLGLAESEETNTERDTGDNAADKEERTKVI